MVCIISPILVLHVAKIPADEFLPWKPNARASWSQAFETSGIVAWEALDVLESATYFSGYADAHDHDSDALEHMYELNDALRAAHRLVESGHLDHVGRLDRLEERLEGARWLNHEMAEAAEDVLREVRARRGRVFSRYLQETKMDPTLEAIYRSFDPRGF
jgi:hypothetical protein